MKGRAVLAFLLSAFEPGLGQIYVGRLLRALVFFVAFLAVVALFFVGPLGAAFIGGVVFVLLVIAIRLFAATDASLVAWRGGESGSWYQRWYVCIPLGVAVSVLTGILLVPVQRFKSYHITSGNMEPTLVVGDRIVADLAAYRHDGPQRGDIVIVASPEDPSAELIHRVVAMGGDSLELRDKTLYVNGETPLEPWIQHVDSGAGSADSEDKGLYVRDQMPLQTVPEGTLFLMGDNRDLSYDSRFIGPVPVDLVRGSPVYVYWASDKTRIGRRLGGRRGAG